MEEREPKKKVSIGATGSGKTYQNMKYILNYYSNPKVNRFARKTLIYDTNLEFKDIKPIAKEDIPAFNKQKLIEVRRVVPINPITGSELGVEEKYELLCEIIDTYQFKNGLLYLEDFNNYAIGANQKHIVNILTTNRHKLMDIYISLQSFRALPPRLWGNINVLTIHKTNDDPFQAKIKEQISGQLKPLKIAYLLVQEKTRVDKRFFCNLDFTTSKITGNFSLKDFVIACEAYLSLSRKEVVDYTKIHSITQQEAKKQLVVKMIKDFNGNVKLKR